MHVEYRISADDYLQFYLYLHRHDPANPWFRQLVNPWQRVPVVWILLMIFLCLFLVSAWVCFLVARETDPAVEMMWFFLALSSIAVPCLLVLLVFEVRRAARNKEERLGRQVKRWLQNRQLSVDYNCRVDIDVKGLSEVHWTGQHQGAADIRTTIRCQSPWSAVRVIDCVDEHVFFDVGQRGWLIIPRRAFPTPDGFDRFVAEAHRLWAGQPAADELETGIASYRSANTPAIRKESPP